MAAPLGDVTIPMRCGNFGNGRFRSGANNPSASKLALQRFKFRLEQADSARLKNLDPQLIFPLCFENGDGAVNLHLRTIGQRLSQRRHGVAPDYTGNLGALVFEREILMTARVQFVIRDFALHPHSGESRFKCATDLRVSSETVKTFDVCGKRSLVSCIEENVQRPTLNVQRRMQNCRASVSDAMGFLDSVADTGMLARL